MKVLFIYGTRVYQDDTGALYIGNGFDEQTFLRYKRIGNRLTFIGNLNEKPVTASIGTDTFNRFPADVRFLSVTRLNSLKKLLNYRIIRNNKQIIRRAIDEADLVILRYPDDMQYFKLSYAIKHGKKIIVEVVGCPFETYRYHSLKGKLIAPMKMLQLKRCMRMAPNAIYVTNQFLQKRYPTKGNSIGISDVSITLVESCVIEKRLKRRKCKECIHLGAIGGYEVAFKKMDDVIRVAAALKKRGFAVVCELVGGGNPSRLEEIAKKYDVEKEVRFIGALSHDNIFAWLDSLDFFLHLSKTEGMPRSLLEAMGRALPCLATDVGGIPEVLTSKYLFRRSEGFVEKIADSVEAMWKNEQLMEDAMRENYETAQQHAWDVLEEKRRTFINNVMKQVD